MPGDDATTTPAERRPHPQQESTTLLRLAGVIALLLGVLTVYFAVIAEHLDDQALVAADHVLVRGLRVVAGACAISGLVIGVFVLNRQDEAVMLAQAARNAEPSGDGVATTDRDDRPTTQP